MSVTKVSDNLYRGPRPLNIDDLKELKSLGISTILSLENGWFDVFHDQINWEIDQATELGMAAYHIQMGDVFPPSLKDINSAIRIILMNTDQKIYVHCLHGEDRTGIVCAAYRVRQGWPLDKAIQEMYSMGFHRFPYTLFGWVRRLKQWCQFRGVYGFSS